MPSLLFILILLGACVASIICVRAVSLPPVLGYLIVGAIVGPYSLGFFESAEAAHDATMIGVAFLMFTIGLEFSIKKLKSMKKLVFGLGLLQVCITLIIAAGISLLMKQSFSTGIILGAIIAMSSTAIVFKILSERQELSSSHGKEIFSILLFQDMAVVPLLILIPALSAPTDFLLKELGFAALKALLLAGLIFILGKNVINQWFRLVGKQGSPELFMLNVLFFALGLSFISELIGLSMGLGAFLAGIIIAESQFRYQVEEDIRPFRDILLGLFFITIGMYLNIPLIISEWVTVLSILILILVFKLAIIFGLSRFFGSSKATALRTALWLCSTGEFGFVLLAEANTSGALSPILSQTVLAAMVCSLILTPIIINYSERIVLRFISSEWLKRSLEITKLASESVSLNKHVLVCGFGSTGQHLSKALEQEKISYIALDHDSERVYQLRKKEISVMFGDCAKSEVLKAAGIHRASMVIITFSSLHATLRIIESIHAIRPGLSVLVRCKHEADMAHLYAAGATEIVPETVEAGIMLATHALALMGLPINHVVKLLSKVRQNQYALLKGFFDQPDSNNPDSDHHTHDYHLNSFIVEPGYFVVGKSISQIGLGNKFVSISAIRRKGRVIPLATDEIIFNHDVIILFGPPSATDLTKEYLKTGNLQA